MTTTTSLINNKDLKPAMKIVIPAGATLTINGEVYPSNISPGFIFAETEIGSLYLSDHRDLQPHKWVTTLETPMDASQPTWISELRAARYRTAVVGKWHFGDGEGQDPEGFDYWDVLMNRANTTTPRSFPMTAFARRKGTQRPHHGLALKWVDGLQGDNPWCVLVWHKAPQICRTQSGLPHNRAW